MRLTPKCTSKTPRLRVETLEDRSVPAAISGLTTTPEGNYTLNLDAQGSATVSGWAINWGDGSAVQNVGSVATATHKFTGPLTPTITATMTDAGGATAANPLAITVNNLAPAVTLTGNASILEGSTYSLRFNATDPGTLGITSYTINWGDAIQTVNFTGSPMSVIHVYPEGPINYVISATATDAYGTYAANNTIALAVTNGRPIVNLGVDTSFGSNGFVATPFGTSNIQVKKVLEQEDGKLVVVSWISGPPTLVRYNADGSLDTSFGPAGTGIVQTAIPGVASFNPSGGAIAGDHIYVGAIISNRFTLVRYDLDGNLDTAFGGSQAHVSTPVAGVNGLQAVLQTGNSIFMVGNPGPVSIARFDIATGQFDTAYGNGGVAVVSPNPAGPFNLSSADVQPDGRVILSGYFVAFTDSQLTVVRVGTNGTIDTTFNSAGAIPGVARLDVSADGSGSFTTKVAVAPDGSIVVTGFAFTATASDILAMSVSSTGTIEHTARFNVSGGNNSPNALAITNDGQVLISGYAQNPADKRNRQFIARLNSDLSFDTTYGTGGILVNGIPPSPANAALGQTGTNGVSLIQSANGNYILAALAGGGSGAAAANFIGLTSYLPDNPAATEGGSFSLVATWTDPGINDMASATVDYGDGTGPKPLVLNPDHTTALNHIYTVSGTHTITVTIADGSGATGTYTQQVSVEEGEPELEISGAATVNEAGTYTLNLAGTPSGDPITGWTINWGDGSQPQVVLGNPSSVSHVYADGQNNYTIGAAATDADGTYPAAATVAVAVVNVAPVLAISGAATGTILAPYALSLSASDAGQDTIAHWTINWGDGTVQTIAGNPTMASHTYPVLGSFTITATATDEDGTFSAGNSQTAVVVAAPASPVVAAVNVAVFSQITVLNADGKPGRIIVPYLGNVGLVNAIVADVTGDGVKDIVSGIAAGAAPHVKVFDGATGATVHSFFAYDPSYTGGVKLASADLNLDGHADIITSTHAGFAPHVRVFDGLTGAEIRSFFAYDPSFTGGVNVAAADMNGDGTPDLITTPDPGAAPHVRVFDGKTGAELASYFAYDPSYEGGVNIAAGDVDGDTHVDIITSTKAGNAPHVKVFDGLTSATLRSFFAFESGFLGGVNIDAHDVDGDGRDDILASAASGSTRIRLIDGETGDERLSFFAPSSSNAPTQAAFTEADGGLEIVTMSMNADADVHFFNPTTGVQIPK